VLDTHSKRRRPSHWRARELYQKLMVNPAAKHYLGFRRH
jgi:hypothetical protein